MDIFSDFCKTEIATNLKPLKILKSEVTDIEYKGTEQGKIFQSVNIAVYSQVKEICTLFCSDLIIWHESHRYIDIRKELNSRSQKCNQSVSKLCLGVMCGY